MLGAEVPPLPTANALPALKATPVAVAGLVTPAGVGMVTTIGDDGVTGAPVVSYTVATPLPLSATHTSPGLVMTSPHALVRFASIRWAATAPSETRFVCTISGGAAASSRRPSSGSTVDKGWSGRDRP